MMVAQKPSHFAVRAPELTSNVRRSELSVERYSTGNCLSYMSISNERKPMKLLPLPLLALATILTSGCVHTYKRTALTGNHFNCLHTNASALIAQPADGKFENINYPGSGKMTQAALAAAFSERLKKIEMARTESAFSNALEISRAGNYTYLIWPEILHWEDRATEWSGKPDRIEIRIQVVNPPDGETIDAVLIQGKSKWATFGGDQPRDLLAQPIHDYVGYLFGVETPKEKDPPRRERYPQY